jgi:HAD superfamily hydrolase (TIGR01509 family)
VIARGLLLDLYDTLVWTDWGDLGVRLARLIGVDPGRLVAAYGATSAARGRGHYGGIAGDFGAVVAACGVSVDDAMLAGFTDELATFRRQNVHVYDDTLPFLRRARAAGTRIAIVSNCDHATRPVVDALGLEREVDAVLLSCEVAALKPDPAIFNEALRRIDLGAADCLFVDDQPRYLDGAAALGIRPVRIERDNIPSAPPDADDRHPVIRGLDQLR